MKFKRRMIQLLAWIVALGLTVLFVWQYSQQVGFDGGYRNQIEYAATAMAEGRVDDAIEHYEKAIDISPTNPYPVYGLAEAYTALEQPEKAVEVLEKFIAENPRSRDSYEKLYEYYRLNGTDLEIQLTMLKNAAKIFGSSSFADLASDIEAEMNRVLPAEVDIDSGEYTVPQLVFITNMKEGERAYYTFDNSDPTTASTPYGVGGIRIPQGESIVKIVKIRGDTRSEVVTLNYQVGEIVEDPTLVEKTAVNGNAIVGGSLVLWHNDQLFYSSVKDSRHIYAITFTAPEPEMTASPVPDPTEGETVPVITITLTPTPTPLPAKSAGALISARSVANLTAADGLLYYVDNAAAGKVGSCTQVGSDARTLTENSAGMMMVVDGTIYFQNKSDGSCLYSQKIGSATANKLTSARVTQFNIYQGYIYYKNDTDGEALYRMRLNGFNKTKIVDSRCSSPVLYEGMLYYINKDDGSRLYCSNLDGSDAKPVTANGVANVIPYEGMLYYCAADSSGIYACGLDGSESTLLLSGNFGRLDAVNGSLYFVDYARNSRLYSMPVAGGDVLSVED